MKKLLLLFCTFFFVSIIANAQDFQVSGFYVNFGTGDIIGYGTGAGFQKNFVKRPRLGLGKLSAGAELIFENGSDQPKIYNTTRDEISYTERFFNHVTGTTLWGKLSYNPFHKVVPGLYIAIGPTVGYWKRSGESYASLGTLTSNGQQVRVSILKFDNGYTFGYRVSAGLNFNIMPKTYIGGRIDVSNNQKSEINSILGLTLGYKIN